MKTLLLTLYFVVCLSVPVFAAGINNEEGNGNIISGNLVKGFSQSIVNGNGATGSQISENTVVGNTGSICIDRGFGGSNSITRNVNGGNNSCAADNFVSNAGGAGDMVQGQGATITGRILFLDHFGHEMTIDGPCFGFGTSIPYKLCFDNTTGLGVFTPATTIDNIATVPFPNNPPKAAITQEYLQGLFGLATITTPVNTIKQVCTDDGCITIGSTNQIVKIKGSTTGSQAMKTKVIAGEIFVEAAGDFKAANQTYVDKAGCDTAINDPVNCGSINRPCCEIQDAVQKLHTENSNGFLSCSNDNARGCGTCSGDTSIKCNEQADCHGICMLTVKRNMSDNYGVCAHNHLVECDDDQDCDDDNWEGVTGGNGSCTADDTVCGANNAGVCTGPVIHKTVTIGLGNYNIPTVKAEDLSPGYINFIAPSGANVGNCATAGAPNCNFDYRLDLFTYARSFDQFENGPMPYGACVFDITGLSFMGFTNLTVTGFEYNSFCSFGNSHNVTYTSTTAGLNGTAWGWYYAGRYNTTHGWLGGGVFGLTSGSSITLGSTHGTYTSGIHWPNASQACSNDYTRACSFDAECTGGATCSISGNADWGMYYGIGFFQEQGPGADIDIAYEACGTEFNHFMEWEVLQGTGAPNRTCSGIVGGTACDDDSDCAATFVYSGGTCDYIPSADFQPHVAFRMRKVSCSGPLDPADPAVPVFNRKKSKPVVGVAFTTVRPDTSAIFPAHNPDYDYNVWLGGASILNPRGKFSYDPCSRYIDIASGAKIVYADNILALYPMPHGDPDLGQLSQNCQDPPQPQPGEIYTRYNKQRVAVDDSSTPHIVPIVNSQSLVNGDIVTIGGVETNGPVIAKGVFRQKAICRKGADILGAPRAGLCEWQTSGPLTESIWVRAYNGIPAVDAVNREMQTQALVAERIGAGLIEHVYAVASSNTNTPTPTNTPTFTPGTPPTGTPTNLYSALTNTPTRTPTATFTVAPPEITPIDVCISTGLCRSQQYCADNLQDRRGNPPALSASPRPTPGACINPTGLDLYMNQAINAPTPNCATCGANKDYVDAAHDAVTDVPPGTAGQILMSNATPASTWTTMSGDATMSSAGALTLSSQFGFTASHMIHNNGGL